MQASLLWIRASGSLFLTQKRFSEDEWDHADVSSSYLPVAPISDFKSDAEPNTASEVLDRWKRLKATLGDELITERYARLLNIESNTLEGVFALGGHSVERLVRAGFFTGAIDNLEPGFAQTKETVVSTMERLDSVCLPDLVSKFGHHLTNSCRR